MLDVNELVEHQSLLNFSMSLLEHWRVQSYDKRLLPTTARSGVGRNKAKQTENLSAGHCTSVHVPEVSYCLQ
jgi:hypothetical protein